MTTRETILDIFSIIVEAGVYLALPAAGLFVCAMLFMSEAERCSKPAAECTTVGELLGVK